LRISIPALFISALGTCFISCACAQSSSPAEGRLKLDVVVTDSSGAPVAGLNRSDFTVLDNNHPASILSFHAYDASAQSDPPIELVLVLDEAGHSGDQVYDEEYGVKKFLQQNSGHLALPTTIYRLHNINLSVTPQPITDGNALAALLSAKNGFREVDMCENFALQNVTFRNAVPHPQSELLALGFITLTERRKPGRKLLVWVGNRGPIGENSFDWITEFSTRLREARITLSTVSFWRDPAQRFPFERHVDGVKSASAATADDLEIDVLAAQTGGQVLAKQDNNLAPLIEDCIQNPNAFYTLSIEPEQTDRPDDYHPLSVQIDKPGLKTHTSMGYYDEPVYFDQPVIPARRLTVAQLEQELTTLQRNSDSEAARKLSSIELTERMSSATLLSWKSRLPGTKSWAALVSMADAAAFLGPPPSEIAAAAAPDSAAQQLMLSRTVDYLLNAIPKLPDFFATRTTVHYQALLMQNGQTWKTVIGDRILRPAGITRATVLYRNGYEVVDFGKGKKKLPESGKPSLSTSGTFGPILSAVMMDVARSNLVWSRWQQGSDAQRAVFSYKIPQPQSHYRVTSSSILADGNTIGELQGMNAYHGEIEIDPASGAVLRLMVEADFPPNNPFRRAGIMVEYGPVEIGGKTCICLERSVSIGRFRSIFTMDEWGASFKVYGPFETMMDDVTFADYHMFHGEARILTGDGSM